jgi:hypothetical protein
MFDILSQEQIVRGLKDRRLYAVADATNISYPTLQMLAKGLDKNYTIHTLYAVSEYIRDNAIDKTDTFNYE